MNDSTGRIDAGHPDRSRKYLVAGYACLRVSWILRRIKLRSIQLRHERHVSAIAFLSGGVLDKG